MEKNDLISIVVPIYNVEKYLKQCLDSIINQTYNNIEILLIDDGATDNCPRICDEYAANDKRIKVIHKKNGGLSDARNSGIDVAKGKYIAFIDSDDYICKEFIEKLYNAIIEVDTSIAQCNFAKVNDNNEETKKIGYKGDIKTKTGYDMLCDLYVGHWENILAWNKLYNIDFFKELRYPFGKIHEDEYTTYKILYEASEVAIVEEYLYKYRQNENSITGQTYKKKRLDAIEAYEKRLEFFENKEEEELYNLTLVAYLALIRECYIKTRKYIANSKDIQKDLIKKYRKNSKKILPQKHIKNREKLKTVAFYVFPNLYAYLKQIK